MKYLSGIALLILSIHANAANTWYWGQVEMITTYNDDGSFRVRLDNSKIKSGCLYDRVDFAVSDMGAERTKAALSMAMTALVSGKEWGVVIDMPASEQVCRASSTSFQGAGLR